jgi:hypothetical protein
MTERKRYRVIVDGGAYTCDMNEAELEALKRKHHGFLSVREVLPVTVKEPTFDYATLAEEIHEYARSNP